MKKFKEFLSNVVSTIIMWVLILGVVIGISSIPDSADQKAYQADCIRLGQLRQNYSELRRAKDFSRAEELREEIHNLERRCTGY